MMGFRSCADICSKGHLIHFLKAHFLQGGFQLSGSYISAELSDKRRRYLRYDLFSLFQGMGQLKDLGLIGNCAKRTVYHAHAAGNTFFIVDLCSSQFITFNSIDPAGSGAGPFLLSNGVIGTYGFTLSALYTFFLINNGFSFYDADGAFGAYLFAGMGHTAPAHIRYLVHLRLTGITG